MVVATAVCWSLLAGVSFAAQGQRLPDAGTILRQAAAQYAQRPPVSCDSETVVTWPGREFKPGERTRLRYVCRVIQDNERVDLTERLLETVDGKEGLFKDSRQIWDGSMFLLRTRLPEMDHHNAYMSKDKSKRASLTEYDRKDSFLDGVIEGFGDDHYARTLLESATPTLRGPMEPVDGHACYVVEASRREGESCTFWIDPAAGYNLRKAVIRRTLTKDPPKPPPGTVVAIVVKTYEFTVNHVTLDQIGGTWFASAGVAELQMAYADGRSHHSKREVRRQNVVWNPDIGKLGAFQMDLPDGTPVTASDQEDTGISYVWRGGRVLGVRQIHDQLIGQPAPPMVVEQWYNANSGRPTLAGRVIVLDFFGVWCPPCMAQVPLLKGLWKRYSEQGLTIIGIHTPKEKEGIPKFIAQRDVSYPIAVDDAGQTAEKYGVYFYPTLVIIDRAGQIRSVNPEEGQLDSLLKSLLEERPKDGT